MNFSQRLLILLTLALAPLAHGQTLEVLHFFNNLDGANPSAGLIQGRDGNFYGTTFWGGSSNLGTIFRITTNGTYTTLVSFNHSNGSNPDAGLVEGNDGNFYGTTTDAIFAGNGTAFKIATNGTFTPLASFGYFNNGSGPNSTLVLGNDGNFYGTTLAGGTNNGGGMVFKMTTNGAVTGLISFIPTNRPVSLTRGNDGNFYGTTDDALGETPSIPSGTVFRITTNGLITTMTTFNGSNGSHPKGGLVQGSDGFFYGTTYGVLFTTNYGTTFRMTTNGELTTLGIFDGNNGSNPDAKLIPGSDGNFYGTTQGGTDGYGTVFRMTPNGNITTLIAFDSSNGSHPSELVQGRDGNFYGTTEGGGANEYGTVFRIVFPSLNSRVNGNGLILSWPTNQVGFTLQSATDLNSPTNWIDSTNAPAVVGAHFTVTNNLSASAQFYRLKKP